MASADADAIAPDATGGTIAGGSAESGQLGDEAGGVGADPGDEVVPRPGLVALKSDDLAVLREGHGVVALGDGDDAWCVFLLQAVKRRVDQAQPLVRVLVGDRHDACRLRRRCAGPPAAGYPESRRPGKGLKDQDARR